MNSMEESAKEWVKGRSGENKLWNIQEVGLAKEELERRLDNMTQYCVELAKINRILDIENKVAIHSLIKAQKGGLITNKPALISKSENGRKYKHK